MPSLRIGTRRFETEGWRVAAESERLFRLSPVQRRHAVATAKTRLARAVAAERETSAFVIRRAAATILSQGIDEIA